MSEFEDNTFRQLFEDPDRAEPADIQTVTFLANSLLVSAPYEILRERSYETPSNDGSIKITHAELSDNGQTAYHSLIEIYHVDETEPHQLFHIQHNSEDILTDLHFTGSYPTDTTFAMAHMVIDQILQTPWGSAPTEVSLFTAIKTYLRRLNPSEAIPRDLSTSIFHSVKQATHTDGIVPLKITSSDTELPDGQTVEIISCDYQFGADTPMPDDFDPSSYHKLKIDISYPSGEKLRFMQNYDDSTSLYPVVEAPADDEKALIAAEMMHESGINFPTKSVLQKVTDALIEFSLQEEI